MTPKAMKITGLIIIVATILIFGLLGPALQKAREHGPPSNAPEEVKAEHHRHQQQITKHNCRMLVISSSVSTFLFGIGVAFLICGFSCGPVRSNKPPK